VKQSIRERLQAALALLPAETPPEAAKEIWAVFKDMKAPEVRTIERVVQDTTAIGALQQEVNRLSDQMRSLTCRLEQTQNALAEQTALAKQTLFYDSGLCEVFEGHNPADVLRQISIMMELADHPALKLWSSQLPYRCCPHISEQRRPDNMAGSMVQDGMLIVYKLPLSLRDYKASRPSMYVCAACFAAGPEALAPDRLSTLTQQTLVGVLRQLDTKVQSVSPNDMVRAGWWRSNSDGGSFWREAANLQDGGSYDQEETPKGS